MKNTFSYKESKPKISLTPSVRGNGLLQHSNVTTTLSQSDKREDAKPEIPRLVIKEFSVPSSLPQATARDKSEEPGSEPQDQRTSVTSFGNYTDGDNKGISIQIDASGLTTSFDYPDGFRWTQTIETNAPLHGTTFPYVDPHPKDDLKPFYWTDAEEAAHAGTFIDNPSRKPPASGETYWQAILGLYGVNGKTATGFTHLTYGFSLDSSGVITPRSPVAGDGNNHRSVLSAEFADWTFR